MITCTKCLLTKESDSFSFKNKTKEIKNTQCKDCLREANRLHYKGNKQAYILRNKERRKERKEWYRKYKASLCCNRCGFSTPAALQFHHTDDNKESSISQMVHSALTVEAIMYEINKCEVLCANCHMIHHHG